MLLEEMLRQVFLSICHVEKLSLTDLCAKVLLEMKKEGFVSFSNVTFLKLYPIEADGVLDVVDAFPELMILVVEHIQMQLNSLFQDEEPYSVEGDARCSLASRTVSPRLSLPRLKMIEITWIVRDTSIIQVV
ncbi:putative F-box/FBD/LRR-repeat protein [Salvia divinorum]|uniref:F-box/FBD/LRR-repeat protein n=1 Tax=Salvia divinorum TaxID=28513 RepID=A0ABD1GJ71_SALDI